MPESGFSQRRPFRGARPIHPFNHAQVAPDQRLKRRFQTPIHVFPRQRPIIHLVGPLPYILQNPEKGQTIRISAVERRVAGGGPPGGQTGFRVFHPSNPRRVP
jgi:hypothetical protein